jgi:hypothetical protein
MATHLFIVVDIVITFIFVAIMNIHNQREFNLLIYMYKCLIFIFSLYCSNRPELLRLVLT